VPNVGSREGVVESEMYRSRFLCVSVFHKPDGFPTPGFLLLPPQTVRADFPHSSFRGVNAKREGGSRGPVGYPAMTLTGYVF